MKLKSEAETKCGPTTPRDLQSELTQVDLENEAKLVHYKRQV